MEDKSIKYNQGLRALKFQADHVVNSFFQIIKMILDYFNPKDIYAVFDGVKPKSKITKSYFNWFVPPKQKEKKLKKFVRPTKLFWNIYT